VALGISGWTFIVSSVPDELLNITEFGSVTEARVIIEDWRNEYNTWRPRSILGGLTPADVAILPAIIVSLPGGQVVTVLLVGPTGLYYDRVRCEERFQVP
jgi:hypothetical protein